MDIDLVCLLRSLSRDLSHFAGMQLVPAMIDMSGNKQIAMS